jgi:hypothetical protein
MANNQLIESYKKKIQGAGNIIYIMGIITIIANILQLKMHLDGTRISNYPYIIIMFVYGYFLSVWGNRIKKTLDKNTKKYLVVVSCISVFLIILSSGLGEMPSLVSVGLCYYSIGAIINMNKLSRAEKLIQKTESLIEK